MRHFQSADVNVNLLTKLHILRLHSTINVIPLLIRLFLPKLKSDKHLSCFEPKSDVFFCKTKFKLKKKSY